MQGLRDEIIKIINLELDAAVERAIDRIMETVVNQGAKVEEKAPSDKTVVNQISGSRPYVKIERYSKTADRVLGRVFVKTNEQDGNQHIMFSGERPWLNNQKNVSCIPADKYTCKRHITANYPESRRAYIVNSVPNRDGILFHSGNIPQQDCSGCILLGLSVGKLNNSAGKSMDAVLQSRDAMEKFHSLILNREFDLEIVEV